MVFLTVVRVCQSLPKLESLFPQSPDLDFSINAGQGTLLSHNANLAKWRRKEILSSA